MIATLLAAFTVGFLGSLHCVGMCGGIVTALTLGSHTGATYRLAYHAGRTAWIFALEREPPPAVP